MFRNTDLYYGDMFGASACIVEIPGAYVRRYDKTSTVSGLRDSLRYLTKLLSFRREVRRGES